MIRLLGCLSWALAIVGFALALPGLVLLMIGQNIDEELSVRRAVGQSNNQEGTEHG